jgi:heat shock protein HslJ
MRGVLLFVLLLSACAAPPPAAPQPTFALAYLDDGPFAPLATLRFVGPDRIEGQAPCNRYSAGITAPLPAFATSSIVATELACDALAAEAVFFDALALMTTAEITGDTLTLRSPTGRTMVFKVQD